MGKGVLVMLLWCCACTPSSERAAREEAAPRDSLTTNTDSRSLPGEQERLAFLARYLRSKSPIEDAEFIIRYQDNSKGMVPGPSDWDIRAVLQVGNQTAAWHAGWVPCASSESPSDTTRQPDFDAAWAEPLLDRRARWQTLHGSPRCYRNPRKASSFVVVYEEDGVVLYRNSSGPASP